MSVWARSGGRIDFGRPTWTLRLPGWSRRIDGRSLIIGAVLLLVGLATAVISLGLGDIQISVPQVIQALVGEAPRRAELVVTQWRLPRVALALVLGFGLGVSGAIFQSLTSNPLGSPDIIGFSSGAYTGALVAMVLVQGSQGLVTGGAVVGGFAVAALVYLLAWRDGVHGFRLIIVGIGISAVLGSVNTWIIMNADLQVALTAAVWGAGSLNVTPAGSLTISLVVTAGAMIALSTILSSARLIESGTDTAQALGVAIQPVRLAMVAIGVVLVAMATAVAGPIGFVALVAPQLARRLTRAQGLEVVPAGLMGAALLTASDTVARLAFAPQQLPVGIVTVSLGGLYLVGLLINEGRRP